MKEGVIMTTPVTLDLQVINQTINTDIESIAPIRNFQPSEAYDVANSTITATVVAPEEKKYRLVLAADVEAGTSAFVRVVSSTDDKFDVTAKFNKIPKKDAAILKPVLEKAGIVLDPALSEKQQLEELTKYYKVADVKIPAGQQLLRIHASQKLHPVGGNPKAYSFVLYAPQLSFNPSGNVRLGATVIFPLDFEQKAAIVPPVVEALPGQPTPNQLAANEVQIGLQKGYGWAFQSDPKITFSYTYN
jgi:hypothetical protein